MTADSLPDDVDPALWFQCDAVPSTRDYLFDAQWHTHWVQGFLAENLPHQPDVDAGDDAQLADWEAKAKEFRVSGRWPAES